MLDQSNKPAGAKQPVVVKKYANRRLYNTETSSYVTLDDLAQMVRSDRDFVVFDAPSAAAVVAQLSAPLMGFKAGQQTFERSSARLLRVAPSEAAQRLA